MSSNVIVFPKGKKNSPPQSIEEVMDSMETIRREHIDFLVDECCSFLFGRLLDEGFDLAEESITKPTIMMVESIKAALCASSGLFHPLHEVAEGVFAFSDEAETEDSEEPED
jgi:hypothetical protein